MKRSLPSLKAKALACIAQREQSAVELRRKLQAHAARLAQAEASDAIARGLPESERGPSADAREIDALIEWLAEKDLLSAARFVDTRVHARSSRFGNLRIRQELSQHGLSLDAAQAQGLQASELQRAQAVWAKRFGATAQSATERARQMRFLGARGFSAEVVRRVVSIGEDAGAD